MFAVPFWTLTKTLFVDLVTPRMLGKLLGSTPVHVTAYVVSVQAVGHGTVKVQVAPPEPPVGHVVLFEMPNFV